MRGWWWREWRVRGGEWSGGRRMRAEGRREAGEGREYLEKEVEYLKRSFFAALTIPLRLSTPKVHSP